MTESPIGSAEMLKSMSNMLVMHINGVVTGYDAEPIGSTSLAAMMNHVMVATVFASACASDLEAPTPSELHINNALRKLSAPILDEATRRQMGMNHIRQALESVSKWSSKVADWSLRQEKEAR